MTDEQQPDLTAEQERQEEASSSGIEIRPAVLEIDDDDAAIADTDGEPGDAEDDDDDAIEDADEEPIAAEV
jgi:hypothetical protein